MLCKAEEQRGCGLLVSIVSRRKRNELTVAGSVPY